jgi:hypothetical protein
MSLQRPWRGNPPQAKLHAPGKGEKLRDSLVDYAIDPQRSGAVG